MTDFEAVDAHIAGLEDASGIAEVIAAAVSQCKRCKNGWHSDGQPCCDCCRPGIHKASDGCWRHDGCSGYVIWDDARHWRCGECDGKGDVSDPIAGARCEHGQTEAHRWYPSRDEPSQICSGPTS